MTDFLTFLVIGVVSASIYAVTAMGLVVTYNTTGIFNFAQGAFGMVLAFAFWQLWQGWSVPPLLALAIVLLVLAPLLGALVERSMMRTLHDATTGIPLVVTIGLLLLLVGLANSIWNQTTSRTLPDFFPNVQVNLGQVTITGEQLITMGVAIAVAIALRLFFKRTRTGVAMRAVVDDPELVSLNGARSGRLASYSWMIGTMLAGVAGILLAPQTNMNILDLTVLVVYGYSAAVVGRLKSLPLTIVGALILGIANSMAIGYAPAAAVSIVTAALPMALLLLALLLLPQARLAVGRAVRQRPIPVASLRLSFIGALTVLTTSVALALTLGGSNLNVLGLALVLGILGLSLAPLSGYAGQVSLCQFTFLGLGCVVMAKVGGGHSIWGLFAAVGVCGAVGALLSLPALRLRGLYLALATLAFAVLMDNLFFSSSSIMGSNGTLPVGRPDIFGVAFASDRSFAVLVACVLAVCIVGIGALRRSSFGRRLVGMNDSPAACMTAGLNLTATKLIVFTFSAGLAGLAGALYGGVEQSVDANQFQFLLSLAFFLAATLAGLSSLSGPVMAGVFLAVVPVIAVRTGISQLLYVGAGLGAISIGRTPNGLAGYIVTLGRHWRHGQFASVGRSFLKSVPGFGEDAGMKSVG